MATTHVDSARIHPARTGQGPDWTAVSGAPLSRGSTAPAIARAEPSIADSLVRLVEAVQRVITDRIELIRLDLGQAAAGAARGLALFAAGGVFLGASWIVLLLAGAVWLEQYIVFPAALLLVALLSAALGVVAVARGVQYARRRALERVAKLGVVDAQPAP